MSTKTDSQNKNNYNTIEARHAALNYLFLNVAYIAATCDDKLNKIEEASIKKEFPFFETNSEALTSLQTNPEYLYFCCQRILKFCNQNQQIIKNFFVKIFKIIASDGIINSKEIEFVEKFSSYLKLPESLTHQAIELYFKPISKAKIKTIKKSDIKKQIANLHPDKFYSLKLKDENLKTKIINLANTRLQILNEYNKK